MSILSDFEDRIGRALEGGFARVFRAPVQPAELARRLGKEMDRGKKLGVGKVYAPTLYSILLSRQDDQALGGFADTLSGELETYLIGYARERNYELATRPVVRFLIDPELKLGRFEIIGELLSPEELAEELGYTPDADQFETPREPSKPLMSASPLAGAPLPEPVPTPEPTPAYESPAQESLEVAPEVAPGAGRAGIFDADEIDLDFAAPAAAAAAGAVAASAAPAAGAPVAAAGEALAAAAPSLAAGAPASPTQIVPPAATSAPLATVTVRDVDHDVVLQGDRVLVGRLQACEICLTDVNVSREHAAFENEGTGWAIHDLGSTNGTFVNGERVTRQRLRDADVLTIGITELVYHEPKGR